MEYDVVGTRDPEVNGRLTLRWTSNKQVSKKLIGLIWLRKGYIGGLLKHRYESSDFIKGDVFLD
jgi:hypothetical protein